MIRKFTFSLFIFVLCFSPAAMAQQSASFYPFPDWKVQPYVTGLYGYNAVIVVSCMSEYNKTDYGFSGRDLR